MPIKSKKQTQKDMKQTREKAMRIAKKQSLLQLQKKQHRHKKHQ
jgi:hypothetical protein|nr:MAG TPA: hypothetical protein [Caudoviricetes sp.]